MGSNKRQKVDEVVFGISPLGGNSYDEDDETTEGVPLFYDARVGAYISEQAIEELDDRDIALARAKEYQKEEEFRMKAGFRQL